MMVPAVHNRLIRLAVDSDDPGERWEMSVEARFRVVIVWMDSWVEGALTEGTCGRVCAVSMGEDGGWGPLCRRGRIRE
jgi:hypothetical protein